MVIVMTMGEMDGRVDRWLRTAGDKGGTKRRREWRRREGVYINV